MTATEMTIMVFVLVFVVGLGLATMHVLNGIHKTAKEMKDDVKRYKEKYGTNRQSRCSGGDREKN